MRSMVTQERLKQLLHYNPDTGVFIWMESPSRCIKAGDIAGGINPDGYLLTQISGRKYFNHILAYLYMTGSHPVNEIDHINSIRNDNRWKNLRHVTRSENMSKINSPLGISGIRGIVKYNTKWRVCLNKKHLGYFPDIESAKKFIEGLEK